MTGRTMRRLAKHEGHGNVRIEEVPVPSITASQVLVKTHTSLISRGSELLARYRCAETRPARRSAARRRGDQMRAWLWSLPDGDGNGARGDA